MPSKPRRLSQASPGLLLIPLLALIQGCGIFFGGEQKVDTKSRDYEIVRLDKQYPGYWRLIQDTGAGVGSDRSDVAFEHSKSGAIISMNSVCGPAAEHSLPALTKNLLMGLKQEGEAQTRSIKVDGVDALETTIMALPDRRADEGSRIKVRTVVLAAGGCSYDLMYIARPQVFGKELGVYRQFLEGFHVRQ